MTFLAYADKVIILHGQLWIISKLKLMMHDLGLSDPSISFTELTLIMIPSQDCFLLSSPFGRIIKSFCFFSCHFYAVFCCFLMIFNVFCMKKERFPSPFFTIPYYHEYNYFFWTVLATLFNNAPFQIFNVNSIKQDCRIFCAKF